ncbi:MAG TPA: ankyrin repeat domain-containing protein [Terriglobales bacterium]|nr:ankyrin repeat domain-containing protein [Terriglobales bacterium]
MRLLSLCLFLLAAFLIRPSAAHADWVEMGAQVKCDSAAGTFRILPYWDSSSGKAKVEPGFQVVKPGVSTHSCTFGKRVLRVQIAVIAPNAQHCGGAGAAIVNSAAIDNVELLSDRVAIDDDCDSDKPVIDIKLHYADGVGTSTQCVGSADDLFTDRKVVPGNCQAATIEIDRLSAEYSKIDHDLADPATQQAQSATKLAPDEDLAKLYAALADPAGTPICSHWPADATSGPPRYARIAGQEGERVYIHQAHPQLCRRPDDDGCGDKAYVIPGDRVELRFICGAWSNVLYQPRIKSSPATAGWVETSRLYAADPLGKTPSPAADTLAVTPLFAAVQRGNLDSARKLLEAATPQARTDEVPQVLGLAAMMGDLDMLNMMLSNGLHPDDVDAGDEQKRTPLMQVASGKGISSPVAAGDDSGRQRTVDATVIARRLIAAGAKLDAQDSQGATPLFYVAAENNIRVAGVLLDAGADVNVVAKGGAEQGYTPLMRAIDAYPATLDPSLVQLLLDHGAKPDFHTGDVLDPVPSYTGETALTVAARQGYMTVARLLLEHGANPALARADGALPADIAEKSHYPKLAALIRQYAAKKQ